jgi:hypothetical protein
MIQSVLFFLGGNKMANTKKRFQKEPKCRLTGVAASRVPEYIVGADDYQCSPATFVKKHDHSFDEKSNTFISPHLLEAFNQFELLRR